MPRFEIKSGFFLRSANKLMFPKTLFFTVDEAQLKELREVFPKSATEVLPPDPKSEEKPSETPVDPTDDITLAKGVGKALQAKLAEKDITTFSGLKAAMTDKPEEMKELLGTSFEKVAKNFVTPEA